MATTPNIRNDRVGFVGLGNMGSAMCHNLVAWAKEEGLPPITVWNRTVAKTEPFKELGCHIASSPRELAKSCNLVITSLANDATARSVYAELFAGQSEQPAQGGFLKPGNKGRSTIFVDTSTLFPDLVGELEREARKRQQVQFLHFPIFGPPALAQTAELVVVLSGEYHARTHASRFFVPAMARKSILVGENVERAAKLKLLGNSLILGTIELLAESMTLADKTGVGAESLYRFVEEFFPAPAWIGYGKKILEDKFDGSEGFTLEGGIKDASHIRSLAERTSTPMPVIDIAHQHLLTARANGGSSLDWSSLVGGQRIASGLHPFKRSQGLVRYPEEEGGGPPTNAPPSPALKPIA